MRIENLVINDDFSFIFFAISAFMDYGAIRPTILFKENVSQLL